MVVFRSLFPEHYIFKRNNLITNADASLWADLFSMEEGAGIQVDHLGYGNAPSVCKKIKKICDPDLLNKATKRFNKQ